MAETPMSNTKFSKKFAETLFVVRSNNICSLRHGVVYDVACNGTIIKWLAEGDVIKKIVVNFEKQPQSIIIPTDKNIKVIRVFSNEMRTTRTEKIRQNDLFEIMLAESGWIICASDRSICLNNILKNSKSNKK